MRSGWWLPGPRRGAKNVAMTTRSAIGIGSLTKFYGDKHVLRGLDLQVPTGSVLALLGPNGAGKTTTVEILQGLRRRDGGSVTVEQWPFKPFVLGSSLNTLTRNLKFSPFGEVFYFIECAFQRCYGQSNSDVGRLREIKKRAKRSDRR